MTTTSLSAPPTGIEPVPQASKPVRTGTAGSIVKYALAAFFLNLILTSWAVGIVVSGVLLRNGMGAESLAWTLMFVLMPLTCIYYPVSVLPAWLQVVAWALPPTYVFEGMRALVMEQVFRADLMVEAFALNAIYLAAAVIAFLALLNSSRRSGSLLQTGE